VGYQLKGFMMSKKLLLALALLSATHSSFALYINSYSPYLGAALGVQNTQAYNGLYANGFAGYSLKAGQNNNLYLAGELFINTGTLPLNNNYYRRTTYGFGASILPGLIIKQYTIAFARIGIANFRYNFSNSSFTGGQLGFGLQTAINPHWDVRGEYVYTGSGVIRGFGNTRFNMVDVGLVYKFCA
jgi:opacity protein-like surface antigen